MKTISLILLGLCLCGCVHFRLSPNSGECPADFPVKGNSESLIYHTPTNLYYYRTKAEFCFDTPAAAERHGFRTAKW